MTDHPVPLAVAWKRFGQAVRNFASSEAGGKSRWMFAGLVAFLFAINGMNVVNSYVGRDFMTAIADRDRTEFILPGFFLSRCLRRLHSALGELPLHGGASGAQLASIPHPAIDRALSRRRQLLPSGGVPGPRQPGPADRGGHPLLHRHHPVLCAHAPQQ